MSDCRLPRINIPTQPEKRELRLQAIIQKTRKPGVLFIDEAHDLHWRTLTRLKHLNTLLPITYYLSLALSKRYKARSKPIDTELI